MDLHMHGLLKKICYRCELTHVGVRNVI